MGCDSHIIIEVRRKNGKWGIADNKHDHYDEKPNQRPQVIQLLGWRDYNLFAVIAGVRNDGIEPLFEGRGLPEDVSKATAKEFPDDSDYHSHTYFTLGELKAVDWESIAKAGGVAYLNAHQFKEWKETGKVPEDAEDWFEDGVEGNRIVTEAEMAMLLLSNEASDLVKEVKRDETWTSKNGPHVCLGTPLTYKHVAPKLFQCIAELEKIATAEKVKNPDEDVRVIICFDN